MAADLAAPPTNTKRKDAGVAGHGSSIFLDPKRIKLQVCKIPDMMEEDETFAHAPAAAATAPAIVPDLMNTASSAIVPDQVSTASPSTVPDQVSTSTVPDQDTATSPMDEADAGQPQPQAQHTVFWPGFF